MELFVIEGGTRLEGTITPAGNKNAALPALIATLLTDEDIVLRNLPDILDIRTILEILEDLGVQVTRLGPNELSIRATAPIRTSPQPDLSRNVRGAFMFAGPLVARHGLATIPRPGGDRIGRRRIDPHIQALEAMGAEVRTNHVVSLQAPNGLHGADIFLDERSVTATESALMAAVLAKGETIVRNAASEPHVQDLCHLLNEMGAPPARCGRADRRGGPDRAILAEVGDRGGHRRCDPSHRRRSLAWVSRRPDVRGNRCCHTVTRDRPVLRKDVRVPIFDGGFYAHDNEPSHHIAYLYSFAGAPWRTSDRVRSALRDHYQALPGGLGGNDDAGQMSAWFVFSAMGFYPVCPGTTQYIIGSPIFPKVTIHLNGPPYRGETFTVIANNVSADNRYIQSAHLNGAAWNKPWFDHSAIVEGGVLEFDMGPEPNRAWGSDSADAPFSLSR